jgi:hypothetical protein
MVPGRGIVGLLDDLLCARLDTRGYRVLLRRMGRERVRLSAGESPVSCIRAGAAGFTAAASAAVFASLTRNRSAGKSRRAGPSGFQGGMAIAPPPPRLGGGFGSECRGMPTSAYESARWFGESLIVRRSLATCRNQARSVGTIPAKLCQAARIFKDHQLACCNRSLPAWLLVEYLPWTATVSPVGSIRSCQVSGTL